MSNDLLHDFVRTTNQQRAVWTTLRVEPRARDGRPAALLRDTRYGTGVPGKERIGGFLRRVGDVAEGVNADLQTVGRVSGMLAGRAVEIDERPEAARLTADDGDHQGKSQHAGTNERLWRPAHTQPYRQRILCRPRIDTLAGQCRPIFAGPMDVPVLTDL